MAYLKKNNKMKKTETKHKVRILNWSLPAYKSRVDGFKTCPMAGKCKVGCYAQSGGYVWPAAVKSHHENLKLSLSESFVDEIDGEIKRKRERPDYIRIHDSGDFYSLEYIKKWFEIMRRNPEIRFYAYTKMVPLFKKLFKAGAVPNNFTVIYSFGGLADRQIDKKTERHSRVFETKEELEKAGYVDASNDDLLAVIKHNKVGLVYHGANKNKWAA